MRTKPQPQVINGYFTKRKSINTTFTMLNTIGKIVFLRWRKKNKPLIINNLLLVHFGGFGDALLLTSVLDSLKEHMPQCVVDIMANKDVYHILQHDTRISNFYTIDNRFGKKYIFDIFKSRGDFKRITKRYDATVCFRSFMDNGVLPLYLSGISKYMIGFSTGGFSFALDTVAPWVAGVHETEHYKVALKEICPDISIQMPRVIYDKQSALSTVLSVTGETHYLVVHIGSREKYKMLDDLKIKQITEWLLENTTKNIVFTGVESESCFFERLQIRSDRIITAFGAFSIFELIECINKSYGVITVDTFAAQIAAMENVPVLSFVSGVPDYRQWHPLGKLVHVMRHNVPCSPCFKPCEGMECMNHDVTDGLKKAFKESFSIYASHEV